MWVRGLVPAPLQTHLSPPTIATGYRSSLPRCWAGLDVRRGLLCVGDMRSSSSAAMQLLRCWWRRRRCLSAVGVMRLRAIVVVSDRQTVHVWMLWGDGVHVRPLMLRVWHRSRGMGRKVMGMLWRVLRSVGLPRLLAVVRTQRARDATLTPATEYMADVCETEAAPALLPTG